MMDCCAIGTMFSLYEVEAKIIENVKVGITYLNEGHVDRQDTIEFSWFCGFICEVLRSSTRPPGMFSLLSCSTVLLNDSQQATWPSCL